MLDRVTFHVRDGISVTGVGKIYDPSKRKTRTMAGAVIRLSEYEDTGLDPREIVKLKAERDAAVRDWEEHPNCEVCINYTGDSAETGLPLCEDYLWNRDLRDCFEWRGPQQEET